MKCELPLPLLFSVFFSFSFSTFTPFALPLFISHTNASLHSAAVWKTKLQTQNKSKHENNNRRSNETIEKERERERERKNAKQAKENLLNEMQNKLNLRLFALTNVFAGVQLLIAKFIWFAGATCPCHCVCVHRYVCVCRCLFICFFGCRKWRT